MKTGSTLLVEEYTLERLELAVAQRIATDLPRIETKTDFAVDHSARCLVAQLRAFIYGQRLDQKTYRYPLTWWDAFKDRWFPKKLLEWFPVTWKTIEISAEVLYPDLQVDLGRHRGLLKLRIHEGPPCIITK